MYTELRCCVPLGYEDLAVGHLYGRWKLRELEDEDTRTKIQQVGWYDCNKSEFQNKGLFVHYKHDVGLHKYVPWAVKLVGTNQRGIDGYMWDEYPTSTSTYSVSNVSSVRVNVSLMHSKAQQGKNPFGLTASQLSGSSYVTEELDFATLSKKIAADKGIEYAPIVPSGELKHTYVYMLVHSQIGFPFSPFRSRLHAHLVAHVGNTYISIYQLALVFKSEWIRNKPRQVDEYLNSDKIPELKTLPRQPPLLVKPSL